MAQISENQVKAMIRLLSDDDDRVVQTISGKLVEAGDPVVSLLQEAEIEQPEMAARIARVLDEIRGGRIEQEFRNLLEGPEGRMDLERGAFLIARYAFTDLDEKQYVKQLDGLAREVRDRIGRRTSGEETVKMLGRYLFMEQGFHGNTKNYYEPDNSYLNRVLDLRTGIPISLSLVYLLVGKRLGLPVYGIGMPGHFLIKFEFERYQVFVDCFNSGALLTEKDCIRFLVQAGYGFEDRYLEKTSPRAILVRSLKNLLSIYHKLEDPGKEAQIGRFIKILEVQESGESG